MTAIPFWRARCKRGVGMVLAAAAIAAASAPPALAHEQHRREQQARQAQQAAAAARQRQAAASGQMPADEMHEAMDSMMPVAEDRSKMGFGERLLDWMGRLHRASGLVAPPGRRPPGASCRSRRRTG